MNEQAINTVITNYAIENANLKVAVATLQAEKETLNAQIAEHKETKEEK